ncbi:hypothetical protein CR164_06485 [Prosthecochloris marina]|uniref:Uncharacterized protein n=1 Tax=Prosthecochloris marina TaxID=2017681 RepID=A0A317T600_9CHLB|nr:hypothetical protein CR164_06485 [Prosthecochloris marina]
MTRKENNDTTDPGQIQLNLSAQKDMSSIQQWARHIFYTAKLHNFLLIKKLLPETYGGCLIRPTMSLSVVILGLDPEIHLSMKVCMDAASSAA